MAVNLRAPLILSQAFAATLSEDIANDTNGARARDDTNDNTNDGPNDDIEGNIINLSGDEDA